MPRPARVAGVILVALLALPGCGGKSDGDQVRATVTAFRDATAKQDYDRICRRIIAPSLVARLSQLGVPCQLALSKYLGTTKKPTLDVSRVVLHGTTADAYVTASAANQAKALSIVRLVKVNDGWRISSLAAPR